MNSPPLSAAEILEADEQARKKRGLLEQQRAHVHNLVDVQSRQDTANRSEALQLSRSRGAPVDVVERNMVAFRAQDAFEKLSPGNAVTLEISDSWSKLLGSPLGALAVKDPAGTRAIAAAASSDTVDPRTGAPYGWADVPGKALERGTWQVEVGRVGTRRIAGTASEADNARWYYLNHEDPRRLSIDIPDSGYADELLGEVITQFPVLGTVFGYGAVGAGAGAAIGAAGGTAGAGPFGMAVGAGSGAALGWRGGLFAGAAMLEGGLAMSEFEQISAEIERRTGEKIPHEVQRGAALLVGGINGGLESFSLGVLTGLLRLPGISHGKRWLTRAAGAKILSSRPLRPILLSLARRAAVAAVTEGITEGAQEATVIALGEGMVRWSTEEENDIWSEENALRVGHSMLIGATVGTSFVVGASPVVAGIEKASMNQAAKRQGERLDSMNEAANSPIGTMLREADPAAFRAWLQSQVEEGGGDPNLYLNARDFMEFFQSEGIDPETVMESMPDVAEQLPVALSTNADLVIPIADYTTYLNQHHEGLKPHVRHGLRKPSRGDAEANEAEDDARLKAEVERLAALDDLSTEVRELETQILALEEAAPTPRAAEAAEAPELAALRQQLAEKKAERDATTTPGEQVEQTFLQRLVRAGAMRPADARYMGILLRQNAERRAAGPAGEEAFAQAELGVEGPAREEEARPSLEQALREVELGALLNELRLGLQPELKLLPKHPILQALRPTRYGGGGVAPGSKLADELVNRGITPQSHPGLYRVGGNTDLDQFDLTDNPYLVGLERDPDGRPSDRAVLEAIDEEVRGNPLRTEEQLEAIQARQVPREELGRILDQLGIDLETTTNEEVITDLEQRFSERGIEPEVLEETVEGDEFFQQSLAQGWHAVDATPEQQVALDRIIDAHPQAAEIREQFELHRGTPYHDQAAYGAITRQHLEDLLAGLEVDYESGLDNPRFTKVKAAAAAGPEALWAYLETNSFIGHAGKPINSVNATFLNCRPSLACAKFCYATDGNYRFDNTVFKAELVNWAVENDPVRAAQMAARHYKATAEYLLDKALRLNDKGDISEAWLPFIEELNRQDVRVQVFSKRPEVLRQVPEVNLRLLSVDDTNSQQMAADNPDLMLAVVYQGVEDIPFLEQYADRVQVILPVKLGRRTLSKDEITPIPKDLRKHICPVDGFGKKVGKTANGKWNCTRCDKNAGIGCFVSTSTQSVLKQLREDIQNEPDELQTRLDEIRELAGTMEGEERQRLLGRVDLLVSAIRRGVDLEKAEGAIADDEASRDRLTVLEQAAVDREQFVFVGIDEHGSEDADVTPIVADAPSVSALRDLYDDAVIVNPSAERETQLTGQGYQFIDGSDLEQTLLAIDDALYASEGAGGRESSRSSEAVYFDADAGHEQAYGIKIRLATHDVVYGDEPMVAVTIGDAQDTDIHLPAGALINPQKVADLAIQMAGRKSLEVAQEENPARHLLPPLTTLEQAALPDERPLEGAFFSALGRALRTSPQRSMSLPELQAYLKKRGVKQEEIEWTMLEDFFEFARLQHWLASNPDTRPPGPQADMKLDLDTLMEQIKLIKVEEVVLGGGAIDPEDVHVIGLYSSGSQWSQMEGEEPGVWRAEPRGKNKAGDEWHYTVIWDREAGNLSVKNDDTGEWIETGAIINSLRDLDHANRLAASAIQQDVSAQTMAGQEGIAGPAQHEGHTLPGGENYREYLITLPALGITPQIRRELAAGGHASPATFTEGHFGRVAPNVLVHVRVKDRVGPNGERILFIEEIQDDWGKAGREQGYQGDTPPAPTMGGFTVRENENGLWEILHPDGSIAEMEYSREAAEDAAIQFGRGEVIATPGGGATKGVPDRPFKASGASSMLALKRMIAKAAKEGYDSVAWTTGKIQVDRYQDRLRQSVDAIQWSDEPTLGRYQVWKTVPEGEAGDHNERLHGTFETAEEAADVVEYRNTRSDESKGVEIDVEYRVVDAAPGAFVEAQAVKDGVEVIQLQVNRETGMVVWSSVDEAVNAPLESIVGKEIAAKILGETEGEVSGDDLTIGGKGFEDLYDGILVRGADKLGKKFGTKVEKGSIGEDLDYEETRGLEDQAFWDFVAGVESEMGVGESVAKDLVLGWMAHWGTVGEDAAAENAPISAAAYESSMSFREHPVHNLPISEELRASVEGEGLPLFQAAGTGPRGSLKFDADLRNIIMRFTEARDLSTGLHELGHLFFLFLGQDVQRPGADPQLIADMQAALDYLGADTWDALTREQHEVWARSFEAYLREGRAPSVELEGAFRRFRQWLLQIYRQIRQLDVELTPEIREVFDRLLATDEQIERVRSQPHMQPKFATAEAGGMNEAEFADYQAAYDRMKAKAEREIMVKLMAEKRREQTEEWALEYERMYAQAEADINAQPAYQLRHWLQYGELLDQETPEELEHVRLDRDAVVRLYGKEILNVLPSRGKYSVVEKGGVDPDVLAPFFGFKTGDALVRALAETINRKDAITKETDARMKARFGDMLNDGTVTDLALESMEGEARSTFLGRELRLLARRAGQRGTPQAAARRVARRVIAEKRVRDLRPDLYRRAEERNAREILEASEAGDHARAHQAGMEQLLNHFLVVESMRAKEQAQKWSNYLRRMDMVTTRARIGKAGEDYLDQIDALLDHFDFRKISNKAAARRASLAKWIAEQEAADATAVFEISDELREEASSKPWREMTMEELRDLVDAVKNIEHLALLKGKLLRAKEQRDLDAAVERALEGIEANRRLDREALPVETRTVEERWRRRVGQWFAGHRKFASKLLEMDGGPGGAFFDLILRPMDESGDFETAEREKAWNALKELFRPFVPLDQRVKQLATTVTRGKVDAVKPDIELARHVPGTGSNVPALTLQGRLMVVLNMGNAGNRQRLRDGYNWQESDLQAIVDSLSREQMQFVQGIWDFIDSYWDAIAAKQQRVTGVAPQKVERVPLTHSRFGKFAGGYFPAVYDSLQEEKAFTQRVAEAAAETMRGARTRATTRRSHTEARAVKVTDRKIRLDFGVIFEHVDGVIHDLAWHEWLIDANKILGDPRISNAIKLGYGEPVYRDLAKALEDFAAGDVAAEDIRETAFNWLRMGSSVAGMGYNVMTAALQPYGLTQSMVRIGPKWVGVGIAKWLRGADVQETTVKWIYSKSSMMENRSRTMNREIREIQSRVSKGGLFDPITDSYFYLIVKAQQIVDIPTWLGAYEKEMDNSGDEKRAIAMADRAVIDAQGGGQIQDLARFQRGSPMFKLWTNFYSFFNTTYNLTAESYERTDFKNPGEVGRFAVDMLLLYTLPSVLTSMMSDAIYQRYDDDESWGEYALELLTLGQLSYVANTMVGVRELSGGLQGWFDYDGPAGTRFFSAAGDLMRQVSQGELDFSLFKALNQAGGILFHYPSVFVQRFAEGFIALESGESTNPTVLLTGPPKKRR